MSEFTLTIDGRTIKAKEGDTILDAATRAGIHIPTLCYHSDLSPEGLCRVCVVEVKGQRTLCPACAYPVADGMEVNTHTSKVRLARKMIVELLLANHPQDCLTCSKNQKCELQKLARDMGIQEVRFRGERRELPEDSTSLAIVRDSEKCILCKRCVSVCNEMQSVGGLS
ncbi:MAG: 2Fe-2S iron-sulfur cluster-binding protein, partial [Armatimonadota bacterium]